MNPNPPPTQPRKVPKARVMFTDPSGTVFEKCQISRIVGGNWTFTNIPVLVLPFPSLKSAKAAKRFWKLSEEERVEAVAKAMFDYNYGKDRQTADFLKKLRGPLPTWEQLVTECPENVIVESCRGKAVAILNLIQGTT